ncbi:MAG: hypothetical protein MUC54_08285, partial [Chloroflexi bacterium]|nr:hypothetical protein [Chloroflexota bacterium]
ARQGLEWQIATDQPTRALGQLTAWAVARGLEMPSLAVSWPSLEDTYLALLGEADASGEDTSAGVGR